MFADARSTDDRLRPAAPAFEIRVEPRPAQASRPSRKPLPWLRLSLLSCAIVAGLSALALRRLPPDPPPPLPALDEVMPPERSVSLQAPPPAWADLDPGDNPYGLDAPALSGLPVVREARRHRSGGREDGMVVGDPWADEPHIRLTVSRLPRALTGSPASLFIEAARRAAEVELAVTRVGGALPLPTRFGVMEAAPMAIEAGRSRECLVFRLQHEEADLRFFGWYCGTAAAPIARQDLACLFDRLTLGTVADDPALKVLFAQADRRRVCEPQPAPAAEARTPETRPEKRRRG